MSKASSLEYLYQWIERTAHPWKLCVWNEAWKSYAGQGAALIVLKLYRTARFFVPLGCEPIAFLHALA